MFAVRGAVRIDRNDRESILGGARELLRTIVDRNDLAKERVVAAHFTMTPDLDAAFPAYAARELGWSEVPMLGAQETAVPDAPDRMLRLLLLVDGDGEARHVYLGEARSLRPDLGVIDGDREGDLGTLVVVGLGLVGGSAALALRGSGRFREVVGVDLWDEVLRKARAMGAVDRGGTDPAALLGEADVVLLAIPVDRVPAWLERWSHTLSPGTIVTDVGSTKRSVAEAMAGLPDGLGAVAGHPLAGSEGGGIGYARADLFRGAPWALVETSRTDDRSREVVEAMVAASGARPVWTDAGAHDRAVAFTSHVPYLVSLALASDGARDGGERERAALAGPGLGDMVRLARTPSRMMAGVLSTNWPEVRDELESFEERLASLRLRLDDALDDPSGAPRERVARLEHVLHGPSRAGSEAASGPIPSRPPPERA